jgi:hypothetical protein
VARRAGPPHRSDSAGGGLCRGRQPACAALAGQKTVLGRPCVRSRPSASKRNRRAIAARSRTDAPYSCWRARPRLSYSRTIGIALMSN